MKYKSAIMSRAYMDMEAPIYREPMRTILTGGPNDLLLLDDYKEERDKHKKLVDAWDDNKGKA